MWMVNYDLDRGNGRVLSKLPYQNEEEEPSPPPRRTRAASKKSKGKGKAKAVEDDEPEDEEPLSPPPPTRKHPRRQAQPGGRATRHVAFNVDRDDSEGEVDELSDLSEYQASCSPSPRTSARASARTSAAPTAPLGGKRQQPDATTAPPPKRARKDGTSTAPTATIAPPPKRARRDDSDDPHPAETSAERKRRQVSANDGAVKRARVEPQMPRVEVPSRSPTASTSRAMERRNELPPRPKPKPMHRNAVPPLPAPSVYPPPAPPAAPANAAAAPVDYTAMLLSLSPEMLAAGLTHALQLMQQPPPQQ
jgi:hypothetical protein